VCGAQHDRDINAAINTLAAAAGCAVEVTLMVAVQESQTSSLGASIVGKAMASSACGAEHDRDVNAARNTLFAGAGCAHEELAYV